MAIIRVNATQVAQVRQLWQRSRHLYHNLGAEDLTTLLATQIALLAEEREQAWGFVCLQDEARPITLPVAAPNRAYLRALALLRGRAPSLYVAELLNAAISLLQPSAQGHLLIAYGDADWLRMPLFQAGFTLAEEVQFLEFTQLQRWQAPVDAGAPQLQLQPCQNTDLHALAVLDAATFRPLWHFDAPALHELLLTSRLQLARIEGELAGYTALTIGAQSAHLSRLAVHPKFQQRGIGKYLLIESLRHAQAQGVGTVLLNTQVHNRTAQQLYRAIGFRPTGRITPVLTKRIHAISPSQQSHGQPSILTTPASTTNSTADSILEAVA